MSIWTNLKNWIREILRGIVQELPPSNHEWGEFSEVDPVIARNYGTNPKDILGRDGEEIGVRYLKKLHYKILYRNLKFPSCEFDIIAEDPKTKEIVFVEVKTRRSDRYCAPEDEVDGRRARKMVNASFEFVRWSKKYNRNLRFDIIAILWPENEEPKIKHLIAGIDPASV